ncbi:MAG: hypothetical protein JWN66_3030 [Sphingomonas bacterium]|uniref:energy transducer TonB n=1 Tax=Sphingomonas bacterium TaxID=1895847 RepID=UPI00261577D6|nr:energy transducer TonB [Sphingomonas bacterium]MDB5705914.1 hypothetical protein [Sphingomonas bacterium]
MYHWIAMAAALTSAGTETVPLTPSSKWVVDYQKEGCLLTRDFGPVEAPISLGFEPSMARDGGRLVLILPDKGEGGRRDGMAHLVLQPSGKKLSASFYSMPIRNVRRGVMIWLEAADLASLTDAVTINLDVGEAALVALQTGGMTGALRAIRACQDDLIKGWGVDPAARLPESDMPNPAIMFGNDAYPASAIRAGAQGRTVALIMIDKDGGPAACHTVVSAGNEALDKAACSVAMRKAHFPRAERDTKLPLRWVLLPVRWVLPNG